MGDRLRRAFVLFVFVIGTAPASAAPQVELFTPQGEAKRVRQVTARFTEPIVAFGDPRPADAFNVQCDGDPEAVKGAAHWADSRNWVYDFQADLPAGHRCRFTLNPNLKAVGGQAIDGRREFAFHTGGPAVMRAMPHEGDERIDEDQIFLLALDAPIDPGSLSAAWCEAAGINERIPLKAISDSETREILNANKRYAFNLFNLYLKGGPPVAFGQFKIEDKRWRDLPVIGVRCAQRLPPGADIGVVIGPQVKTKSGIERTTPQRLAYKVRPAFLVKLTCQRINKDAACLPITPITIDFNATVLRDAAAGIRLRSNDGQVFEPQLEEKANAVSSVQFKGPFPEKTTLVVELPRNFRDDAGREPQNKASFPLTTATDDYPPLAKFPGRFGILELNAAPLLPVTVRNVEPTLAGRRLEMQSGIPGRALRMNDETEIIRLSREFSAREYEKRAEKELKRDIREGEIRAIPESAKAVPFEVPRALGEKETEVIGIPLKEPGFYIVELASPRLGRALHGEEKPYFVSTSALVTNLGVHLKHGRESSLVWVTSLDRGKPVPDARVTVRDCTGKLYVEGTTNAEGIALIGDQLPVADQVPHCGDYRRVLIAFARVGKDLSFTYSDWNQGIQPWNFNVRSQHRRGGSVAIHTIFDRTLLRSGETVSMKHVARTPTGPGFLIPDVADLPKSAEIEHVGSGQRYKLDTRFDAQGVAENTWTIPREAKLGTYRLVWQQRDFRSSATFRVEAFRVPLMRAVLSQPKEPAIRPTAVKLDAAVTYLSGGPAANLPVKYRYRVEQHYPGFRDYSDFAFGGKAIKEGIEQGSAEDMWSTFDPDEETSSPSPDAASPAASRTLTLDAAGTAKIAIEKLPPVDRAASLLVEMEYSDPNGEILAVSTNMPLHPAGVYVGIKPEGWAASKKSVRAQIVALDTAGKPLANRPVTLDVYERRTYSNRRRLVGGFYAYDSTTETKRVGSACSATTDARGLAFCTVKPRASGELILVARAKDDGGREAFSTASVWIQGDDEWWFEPTNHDRIDLIAEKKRYEPGETARLQVRMPFRQATVLVTVEREGVLWQKVVELDAKSPVIEVPVIGSYGPNVFISALALRGRVDAEVPGPYAWLKRWMYKIGFWLGIVDEVPIERDTRPTGLVDLTKPAYKLGLTEIKVGRREYALNVKVAPERDVLKVRDTVRVAIQVADSDGKPAANGEIALAAVDEGLLELMDNKSWDILEAMLGERGTEVLTSTAQGHVIGKRHFGKKAVAPGGGGGRGGARELLETLLMWKGRVQLDGEGRATLSIPLNDALTSFRIVAVAHAGAAKFGHGSANIRTTQDLMLFSGLPPVVREQDEYSAMFTLRNATAQALSANFAWTVRDRPADDKTAKVIASGEQALALAGNEAKIVSVPMKAPIGIERLHWEISATAKDEARDRLRATQKVVEVHPVRVYQATLARVDKTIEFSVERPGDALPGRGGIRVDVMATLGSDLSAVREFFSKYPYVCLEQRVSKAIGLNDDQLWNALGASLPSYLDRDGLARYFPIDWIPGSDTLTAYLVQIASDSGREWPEAVLNRMLKGLDAFATGRIVRNSALPTADLTIRKLAAIEALARHNRARAAMLDVITIDPALWPTSALIDWIGILKRVDGIPRRAERLKEALTLLRARINFQGTTMTFSTERDDALWWLMVSGDVNANRGLIAVLDAPEWKEDIGRLVRGTLSRQKLGKWSTTIANAWGTVALARYADAFEKVPAAGTVAVTVGDKTLPFKVTSQRETHDFDWPSAREALKITHSGGGAPWTIVQSRAALPLKAPISTGYAIKRTVTPVEQKDKTGYARGDVYRVSLEIDAQTDMTWVVVDDPIPSGALILGSGLGRDAASYTQGEKREGWAWPTYIERTQEAYRAYYQFVPKGRFKLEYTVRLNNPGRFDLPTTRVEALYAPEMFGELPNQAVAVKP